MPCRNDLSFWAIEISSLGLVQDRELHGGFPGVIFQSIVPVIPDQTGQV
jgi:hypothetical protein